MAQADTMMAGCTALAMSPDDRLVVSCSSDGSVRVSPIDFLQQGSHFTWKTSKYKCETVDLEILEFCDNKKWQ